MSVGRLNKNTPKILCVGYGIQSNIQALAKFSAKTLGLNASNIYTFDSESLDNILYINLNTNTLNTLMTRYFGEDLDDLSDSNISLNPISTIHDYKELNDYIPESVDIFILDAFLDIDKTVESAYIDHCCEENAYSASVMAGNIIDYMKWVNTETESILHIPETAILDARSYSPINDYDTLVHRTVTDWKKTTACDNMMTYPLPYRQLLSRHCFKCTAIELDIIMINLISAHSGTIDYEGLLDYIKETTILSAMDSVVSIADIFTNVVYTQVDTIYTTICKYHDKEHIFVTGPQCLRDFYNYMFMNDNKPKISKFKKIINKLFN